MKIGAIGTGLLGEKHAGTVSNHPDTNLAAVAEPRSAVGSPVAKQFDTNFYGSAPEMLSKEDLDALIVATPDPLHAEPVVAATKAGVPTILT